MVGATLPHVDFVVADQDVSVDDAAAVGANAARQLIENVVRVLFGVKAEVIVTWLFGNRGVLPRRLG